MTNFNQASGIGSYATNVAGNLVLAGGTLEYTGGGASTDRLFTLGVNGGTIDAEGTGIIQFTNSGAIGFTGSGARTLTLTGTYNGINIMAAAIGDADASSPTSLQKTGGFGASKWMLTGANTYTGAADN